MVFCESYSRDEGDFLSLHKVMNGVTATGVPTGISGVVVALVIGEPQATIEIVLRFYDPTGSFKPLGPIHQKLSVAGRSEFTFELKNVPFTMWGEYRFDLYCDASLLHSLPFYVWDVADLSPQVSH